MTDDRRRELLAGALAYAGGSHTVDDVLALVAAGQMQKWEGLTSIVVTQINQYPRCKELYFFLAAGDMDEVKELYSVILAWGRSQGCDRAGFIGRPGWARSFVTKDEGWTTTMSLYTKELV